jgi:hypothetical protein
MMNLIVKAKKGYISPRFKNKLYHFDKYDVHNLKLPEFIEDIKDKQLFKIIQVLVEKYKSKSYIGDREELDEQKDYSDMEILYLLKFYKNGYSFLIDNEKDFFPHWAFTYNPEPLKKELDKIVGHCYDKVEPNTTKWYLLESRNFSALDVTYLLHYFVITHPDYIEEE